MTGVSLPDADAESRDGATADEIYDDAVLRMRELTRDRERYPRVYSELLQYSTARNLYGLKPLGLSLASTTFVVALSGICLIHAGIVGWPWWPSIASGATAFLIGSIWIFAITPGYVHTAAKRYAEALLATAAEPSENSSANQHS